MKKVQSLISFSSLWKISKMGNEDNDDKVKEKTQVDVVLGKDNKDDEDIEALKDQRVTYLLNRLREYKKIEYK